MTKKELDQIVLSIEFLLISVVQGVALAALATSASGPIASLEIEYWPYIASAFLLILIFWSQAIIHAISFINWPLDLTHTFLYFLAGFIEVVAFTEMTNPLKWFGLIVIFFIVAAFLYIIDLQLIKNRRQNFQNNDAGKKLYSHILKEQLFELSVLVPAGFIYNAFAFYLIYTYPNIFITQKFHVLLIIFQVAFGLLSLFVSIKSFKKRSRLITQGLS